MSCDVSLEPSGDGEHGEMVTYGNRKARKDYRCGECGTPILRGETHVYVAGKWDGEFSTFRYCVVCDEIGKALSEGGGWDLGALWDDLYYELRDAQSPADCLSKLKTPAAKMRLREKWGEAHGAKP